MSVLNGHFPAQVKGASPKPVMQLGSGPARGLPVLRSHTRRSDPPPRRMARLSRCRSRLFPLVVGCPPTKPSGLVKGSGGRGLP